MAEIVDIKNTELDGIIVDDGGIEVPINNKRGDQIGVFYFHPTDVGIIDRFNEMAGDFAKITGPLEKVNIAPDGTAASQNEVEITALKEAETNLYSACDRLFGGNMSQAFFGKMHPFSPVGGRFYCELALEAVGKYISQQFDVETKKISARVAKYTSDHQPRTGKLRNGKA